MTIFFYHLPPYVDIFYLIRVDKKLTFLKYLTYYILLTSSCQCSQRMATYCERKIYDMILKSKDGIVWICWTESKVGIAKLFVFELITNKIVVKIISDLQNGKKSINTIKGSCSIKHFIKFGAEVNKIFADWIWCSVTTVLSSCIDIYELILLGYGLGTPWSSPIKVCSVTSLLDGGLI